MNRKFQIVGDDLTLESILPKFKDRLTKNRVTAILWKVNKIETVT